MTVTTTARALQAPLYPPLTSFVGVRPDRALARPLAFTQALLALGWLPSEHQSARLSWSLWGTCAGLLAWNAVLLATALRRGRTLAVEVVLRKQHSLQACAQGAVSTAFRVEGVPRYDLLGASHGFRRPGVETFIEPGFSYAKGSQMLSFNVPIGFNRDRKPDPYTGLLGDATFPRYIFLGTYGYRFGGKSKPPGTAIPCG